MSPADHPSSPNQVARSPPHAVQETKEAGTRAHASAGINLNLFGAIAGAFSGKSKQETAADGSSTVQREEHAEIHGAGQGTLNAVAAGGVEQQARQSKAIAQ